MKKHSFLPMWQLIRRRKFHFSGALFCAVMAVLIGFVTPALLAEIIDHYLGSRPSRMPGFVNDLVNRYGGRDFIRSNLWIPGLALVIISLVNGLFSFLKSRWSAYASEDIAQHLRNRLYNHIQHLPYAYHVKAETGDLIQRCTSDVDTVRRFLNVQLMSVVNSVLMIAIALSLMFPISARITLICLTPMPLMLLFAWRFFSVVMKSYNASEEAEGKLSTVLQENLTGVRVVRAFGQQQSEVEKFEHANDAHHKIGLRVALLDSLYWTSGDLFGMAMMLMMEVMCIIAGVRGEISIGDMVILISYSGMLMNPTRQLGRILSGMGRSMVALERINAVLKEETEPVEPEAVKPPLNGDIEFDNVSFSYDGTQEVLDGLSLTIQQGQTVALLGATGSGKSTLVHLLQRLYEPTGGEIRIGGVPIHTIDRKHLRSRVGLVLQEPFLYSKTIRDNVAIAVRDAGQDAIDRAAGDAAAYEFIQQSEQGYETMVGERGVTLSGGQKQRVAIARMLLKDNDILIFDDSLSAVDTETDAQIRAALNRRAKGLTTIIISHRITTLREADCIFVLENGRIAESGTHEVLIQSGGLYARIHNIQEGLSEEERALLSPA
ncbi:MAG: ABC transporter ATP-binding protein [Clostridiales bacterium]|nr:ABC transporter ATP-binding protein [Clostridiales bacterium]